MRSFPSGGGQQKISSAGGQEPRWCCNGRELFFIAADGAVMAVPVTAADTFKFGPPTRLFATRIDTSAGLGINGRNQYVVSGDGRRFLIYQPSSDPPISIVLNWRPPPR